MSLDNLPKISNLSSLSQTQLTSLRELPIRVGDGGDEFVMFYLDFIATATVAQKKKLVRQNPDLVERIFTLFHNCELGTLYVNKYGTSQDRHHTAYFISIELGTPITRRLPLPEDYYVCDPAIMEIFRASNRKGRAMMYAQFYRVQGSRPKTQSKPF